MYVGADDTNVIKCGRGKGRITGQLTCRRGGEYCVSDDIHTIDMYMWFHAMRHNANTKCRKKIEKKNRMHIPISETTVSDCVIGLNGGGCTTMML